MDKSIYLIPDVKMKHSNVKTMPDEETVRSWIRNLKTVDLMHSDGVNIVVANSKGFMWKNFFFNLNSEKFPDDKDDFYATMLELSLTHWIAAVSDGVFANLYLNESKDGQTNITPDVLDALYWRMADWDYRNSLATAKFENGFHLSA